MKFCLASLLGSIVVSSCVLMAAEPTNQQFDTLQRQGLLEHPSRGQELGLDYIDIVDECSRRIEDAGPDQSLLLLRAQAHIGIRQYELAIADASQVLQEQSSVEAAYVLGRAAAGNEDYQTTQQAIDVILRIDKDAVEAKTLGAIVALARDHDRNAALAAVDAAIEADPQHMFAYALRSAIRKSLKDNQGALDDINHYLQHRSVGPLGNSFTIFLVKSQLLAGMGKPRLANECMQKAVTLGGFKDANDLIQNRTRSVRVSSPTRR